MLDALEKSEEVVVAKTNVWLLEELGAGCTA